MKLSERLTEKLSEKISKKYLFLLFILFFSLAIVFVILCFFISIQPISGILGLIGAGFFLLSILSCAIGDTISKKDFEHNKDFDQRSRSIPKYVRNDVWRRDRGRCVECGSQERLEFDHIIPFSKGGSNTARNIQLLCEKCNKKKSNSI